MGKHFGYIDALRGYAILGVMIVHGGGSVEGLDVQAKAGGRARRSTLLRRLSFDADDKLDRTS